MDEKFLQRMDSQLAGWADPLARLRDALVKNEFELYCQPMRALAGEGGYPLGEVLVRMREEERALLPPGEFLPVFEHFRMMPQLDRWVVFHVVQKLARGARLPRLTVNVASQTLEDPEFPAYVGAALDKFGAAPGTLLFEIDETDMLARPEAAGRFASAAKGLGCGLLIDGFGRRSVSFTPLKALRVDFVKLDGSVVRKLLSSGLARTKLNAVLRVAEALKFGVVAECVEEAAILEQLRAAGATHAQGFGVHQPQPLETF